MIMCLAPASLYFDQASRAQEVHDPRHIGSVNPQAVHYPLLRCRLRRAMKQQENLASVPLSQHLGDRETRRDCNRFRDKIRKRVELAVASVLRTDTKAEASDHVDPFAQLVIASLLIERFPSPCTEARI